MNPFDIVSLTFIAIIVLGVMFSDGEDEIRDSVIGVVCCGCILSGMYIFMRFILLAIKGATHG